MLKLKKISCLFALIAVFAMGSSTVFASEVIDKNSENTGEVVLSPVESDFLGSVTIFLDDTEDALSKEGVEFSVSKVADVENGIFVLDEDFKESDIDLNEIDNANELDLASEKLSTVAKEDFSIKTDADGIAVADELEVGVYLFYVKDAAEYDIITPFMVSIPTFNEVSGTMSYDIEVMPKHTPVPEESEDKDVPQTGYANNTMMYGMISLAAVCGCVYFVTRSRRLSR